MSRLKREGNPPSGQLASPVPQAWDPSINDFREITGQNLGGGRFGADGVQWGKTASGLFVPVRVTDDGVQEVQLSGTIVRDVLGYFSLRAAGGRYFFGATGPSGMGGTLRPLDIRGFKKISIYFLNGSSTYGTRNKLRVTFHRTLDVQEPGNAFAIAPQYEFADVPANGSFRLLLTSDLSDLAGTPPDGLAIRYLPDLVGLVFSYDQASSGADGDKIILFSGVR